MSSEIQRPNHTGLEGLYCLHRTTHRDLSSARRCAREVFVEKGSASQLTARLCSIGMYSSETVRHTLAELRQRAVVDEANNYVSNLLAWLSCAQGGET
jgi:hypothetical protein